MRPAQILESRCAGRFIQRQAQERRSIQVQSPDGGLVERLGEDLQLIHVAVEGDGVVGEVDVEVPAAAVIELVLLSAESDIICGEGQARLACCGGRRSEIARVVVIILLVPTVISAIVLPDVKGHAAGEVVFGCVQVAAVSAVQLSLIPHLHLIEGHTHFGGKRWPAVLGYRDIALGFALRVTVGVQARRAAGSADVKARGWRDCGYPHGSLGFFELAVHVQPQRAVIFRSIQSGHDMVPLILRQYVAAGIRGPPALIGGRSEADLSAHPLQRRIGVVIAAVQTQDALGEGIPGIPARAWVDPGRQGEAPSCQAEM